MAVPKSPVAGCLAVTCKVSLRSVPNSRRLIRPNPNVVLQKYVCLLNHIPDLQEPRAKGRIHFPF